MGIKLRDHAEVEARLADVEARLDRARIERIGTDLIREHSPHARHHVPFFASLRSGPSITWFGRTVAERVFTFRAQRKFPLAGDAF
jgi:hypothetical protein